MVGRWPPQQVSMAMDGHLQTNNRAELDAVLDVLNHEPRNVHIKTDSEHVLKGCLVHRFSWAAVG